MLFYLMEAAKHLLGFCKSLHSYLDFDELTEVCSYCCYCVPKRFLAIDKGSIRHVHVVLIK